MTMSKIPNHDDLHFSDVIGRQTSDASGDLESEYVNDRRSDLLPRDVIGGHPHQVTLRQPDDVTACGGRRPNDIEVDELYEVVEDQGQVA